MKTVEVEDKHPTHFQNEADSMKIITLHCIAFPGFTVTQNDYRMWNMLYKYKNICTVQLKFLHKKIQENSGYT
jgi:hypothetical protein